MFSLHGIDRLAAWKEFRNTLESSHTALEDVAVFWSQAPFVGAYLDHKNPDNWPDPWQLIMDSKLDDLAIALGMLYTIKLTSRFVDTQCEIHTAMLLGKKEPCFVLIVDKQHVLNLEYKAVVNLQLLFGMHTSMLWDGTNI